MISLDFELHWGVFDSLGAHDGYRDALIGAREAVPRMLEAFAQRGVRATWAVVGFLFAESREELEAFAPAHRPAYSDRRRDPYRVAIGPSEREDPLHYAPSLIRAIAACPGQEIATHTFSHYYCHEPGQTREQFEADLRSAVAIAFQRRLPVSSIVFPRNQVRSDYLPILEDCGITAFRGQEAPLALETPTSPRASWLTRGRRFADSYVGLSGSGTVPWSAMRHGPRLANVAASRFLRPTMKRHRWLDELKVRRVTGAMQDAARRRDVFHVWWHPHNFGSDVVTSMRHLEIILDTFVRLRDADGMQSLNMRDVARSVLASEVGSGG